MNEFADYYKTISTSELLDIVENPQNYQQVAVLAAQTEIASRNLNEEEMSAVYDELNQKKETAKILLKEKQESRDKKIQTAKKLFDQISPGKDGLSPAEKAIRRIVLIFCFFITYWVIANFAMVSIFIQSFFDNPLESLLYLFPIIFIIMGLFLFWRKKPTGWILLCFCFIYDSIPILHQLFDMVTGKTESRIIFFDAFRIDPAKLFVSLVLYVGTLLLICRTDIRKIFEIEQKKMILAIFVSLIISVALYAYTLRR